MATPIDAVSANAVVTPPATGRPWKEYELTVCEVVATVPTNCRTLPQRCQAVANKDLPTTCPIDGLKAETDYVVTAKAYQADGTVSPPSNPDDFRTPAHV